MWKLSDYCPNRFQNNLNLTWPSNTTGISLDSRLEYSKIIHRYAKVSPFTWFLGWKLPIDTDFIHSVCHFHQAVTWMPESVLMGQLHLRQGMLGALIVWWPASFWLQWPMAESTVHTGSPAKFSTKPTEAWRTNRKMYAMKQIKFCAEYRDMLPRPRLDLSGTPGLRPIGLSPGSWQTSLTGTCYPGLGWICQVHLGFGLSASAQVPDKPALALVACPGILHRS